MKTDMQKLKGKIVERGKSQEAVADAIGIDRSTFYRKVRREGESFSIGEAHKIAEVIPLTHEEAMEIFLAE